jgi:arginyl-tRNA synthetase
MHALYVRVNKETKTNPDLAQEARDEFMALEQGDSQNTKIWEMMRAANIAENDALYKSIGVKFDTTIGESSYVSSGQAIVGELIAKGIAQIGEDDSVYIPSTDDSTLPLVIRKADGSSLYGTRDLAAIRHRVNTLGATSIKYVVGAEQASYFDTIFAVARQAGILPDASDAKHVKIGLLLNGDGKKVSSRSGEATSFQSVLDNAITSAQHYVQAVGHDISPAEVMDLAKKFGLGSVAFGVLGNDISKNSVVPCEVKPDDASIYAQTTHARANQIIEQSRGFTGTQAEGGDFEYQHPDEWLLAKALMEVPAAVAKAAEQDGPHHVASALQIVASAFNKMYRNPELRIIDRQLQTVSRSRWALSEVTRATLHDGLRLLAIEVPDKI